MKIYESLVSGGFGIADLAGLFLLKPIQRIHKMMGDMSQVLLVLNSFQIQSALRFLQMDLNLRATIGETAERIGKITVDCVTLIENYFEKSSEQ